jgi:hypothetical protein
MIKSSEKLRHSATETETKAMLYLMNFRNDSNEIYYFIVDFFNDLTGMDRMSQRLWDLQSKGASNSSPNAIGKELVTLFKNYISDFEFHYYILFLGGVTSSLRKDDTKNIFDISNIKDTALINIKTGLIQEGKEKTYIDDVKITKENIANFLKKVLFVVDDKEPSEYVKSIIGSHMRIMPENSVLTAIFNEIRDKQASKKNISSIEGITIETTDEALNYCRHLTSSEIKLMVLGRIINRNPFNQGIPQSFIPIYNKFPPEKQKETLEDCQLALSRALFDKNGADDFWDLFENIYHTITLNIQDDVNAVFNKIDKSIMCRCSNFDVLSLKYFIAGVKDGVQ